MDEIDAYSRVGDGLVVVGSGMAGLVAALVARTAGHPAVILEKAPLAGGATAASGGQVWVPANHLMKEAGQDDTVEAGLEYVVSGSGDHPSFDRALAEQWLRAAPDVVLWLERHRAVSWQQIPDYPDYCYPDAPGSRSTGRYMTSGPVDGRAVLGSWRGLLRPAPHFPIGLTYAEIAELGGPRNLPDSVAELLRRRRADDFLTHGQGLAAALLGANARVGTQIVTGSAVVGLMAERGVVRGVEVTREGGPAAVYRGSVVLATGAHDWAPEWSAPALGDPANGGSVAPASLTGDAMRLARQVGGVVLRMPAESEVRVPGYRLPSPEWEGDDGYRGCWEQSLPHCFIVDRQGRRFCDDSHRPAVAAAALADPSGERFPIYLVWDSQHHRRYGLGSTGPGHDYPEGLVAKAGSLAELAAALAIEPRGLVATAQRFNDFASSGKDPDFGRGSNAMGRAMRGDRSHPVHPNVAPVEEAPFYGMRLSLVATGIGNAGVRIGQSGRVLREDDSPVSGLYAVGAAAGRSMTGTGYNSGFSLSQGMTLGYLAARDFLKR